MEFTRDQIDSVRLSKLLARFVRRYLNKEAPLAKKPRNDITDEEWDTLHDASWDVLVNESPLVQEFLAEQDNGIYHIEIRGIPGAYFVRASEFDNEGIFSTLAEACECVESTHGEFIHSEGDKDEEIEEEWIDDPFAPAFNDQLIEILAGAGGASRMNNIHNAILGNKKWILLANGNNSADDPVLIEIRSTVNVFRDTLPKVQGFANGGARMSRLQKLVPRIQLYIHINGHMPSQDEMLALFNL